MPTLWVVPEELPSNQYDPEDVYEACKVASHIIWSLSGRKYNGVRTVTEVYECPCSDSNPYGRTHASAKDAFVLPYNTLNVNSDCGCSGLVSGRHASLRLRGSLVRAVHEVKKNGTILDPSTYAVINSSTLQISDPTMDVCGLEVTYTYGTPIPYAGRRAAFRLASELLLSWTDDAACSLPANTTSVSRQGVSFTVFDPQSFLNDGKVGLYEVDLFLRAVNPTKALKKSRVFSPDLLKAKRITSGTGIKVWDSMDLAVVPPFYSLAGGLPRSFDLDIYRGDSAEFVLRLRSSDSRGRPLAYLDLTGYEVKASIRAERNTDAVLLDLDIEVLDQDTLKGGVEITIPADTTASFPGIAFWDLEITSPEGEVKTILAGKVRSSGQVTAPTPK